MGPEPRVSPRLVSLLSACTYSTADGLSQPEAPMIPHPADSTETTREAETTAGSRDAEGSSAPRRATRKRGRPRKNPNDGADLTPKEVCAHVVSDSTGSGGFERLTYRSGVGCKFLMRNVPTNHERK